MCCGPVDHTASLKAQYQSKSHVPPKGCLAMTVAAALSRAATAIINHMRPTSSVLPQKPRQDSALYARAGLTRQNSCLIVTPPPQADWCRSSAGTGHCHANHPAANATRSAKPSENTPRSSPEQASCARAAVCHDTAAAGHCRSTHLLPTPRTVASTKEVPCPPPKQDQAQQQLLGRTSRNTTHSAMPSTTRPQPPLNTARRSHARF